MNIEFGWKRLNRTCGAGFAPNIAGMLADV